MNTQMLSKQIKDSQKELEALQIDEAELTRLHSEKSTQLDTLRASKSRDFASMAAFEGQRSALTTMLAEQRGEIEQVQSRISELEAQQARLYKLQTVKATAGTIREKRTELHAGVTALSAMLAAELPRLVGLIDEWRQQRRTFQGQAEALGVPLVRMPYEDIELVETREQAAESLFAELAEQGVDVEALRLSVFATEYGMTHLRDLPDRLPMGPGGLTIHSRAAERLPVITAELLVRFMELSAQDAWKTGEEKAV